MPKSMLATRHSALCWSFCPVMALPFAGPTAIYWSPYPLVAIMPYTDHQVLCWPPSPKLVSHAVLFTWLYDGLPTMCWPPCPMLATIPCAGHHSLCRPPFPVLATISCAGDHHAPCWSLCPMLATIPCAGHPALFWPSVQHLLATMLRLPSCSM